MNRSSKPHYEPMSKLKKEEDTQYGDDDGEGILPPEMHNKKAPADRIKAALAKHQACTREKPKAVSVTDPECRMIKRKRR